MSKLRKTKSINGEGKAVKRLRVRVEDYKKTVADKKDSQGFKRPGR